MKARAMMMAIRDQLIDIYEKMKAEDGGVLVTDPKEMSAMHSRAIMRAGIRWLECEFTDYDINSDKEQLQSIRHWPKLKPLEQMIDRLNAYIEVAR